MTDFTKAGLDRGDMEMELKNLITSAKVTFGSYLTYIQDLTQEEIKHDYDTYFLEYKNRVKPKVRQAMEFGDEKISQLAIEYQKLYEEFLKNLEKRLKKEC